MQGGESRRPSDGGTDQVHLLLQDGPLQRCRAQGVGSGPGAGAGGVDPVLSSLESSPPSFFLSYFSLSFFMCSLSVKTEQNVFTSKTLNSIYYPFS